MEKQSTRKFLKLIVALVVLFLLGSSALLLASCKEEEHEHAWDEGTVTTSATCTTPGVMTFHCTVDGCTETKTEEIKALGHDYQLNADQSKDATCTSNGSSVYVCSRCGDSYAVTSPATGHKLGDPVTVDATCVKAGSVTRTCSVCGYQEVQVIPATGVHTWDEGEVTIAATCGTTGLRTYHCVNCSETKTEAIPATGEHSFTTKEQAASCEVDGLRQEVCEVCGYVKSSTVLPKLDHSYVNPDGSMNVVDHLDPTCVTAGYNIYECIRCKVRYQDPIPALSETGSHTFAPNTDTEDTLSAALKAEGWTTVTAANCTTAGTMERVCTVCGYVDKGTIAALGHHIAAMDGDDKKAGTEDDLTLAEALKAQGINGLCYVDPDLVDAQGQKIYTFVCDREGCPCETVIDAYGNTENLVPAVDHTWTNADGSAVEWKPGDATGAHAPTCTTAGKVTRTCPVCGQTETKDAEALEHAWNTMQLDGRTTALVCDDDPYLDISNEDGLEALYEAISEYYDNDPYKADAIYQEVLSNMTSGNSYARFCFRCGEVEVAKDHEWVVGTLQDGKYNLSDYVVDEDGNVVVAEGVTEATMTCRNVLVCKNCGTPDHKGDHPTASITPQSCRAGSYCELCGEQLKAQLQHQYLDMADVLNENVSSVSNPGHADKDEVDGITYNNKAVTYGQLREAYEKVLADEAWLKPVTATCTTAGTEVYVCYKCLLDAAADIEFEWKTGDEVTIAAGATVPANGYEYSAYVIAVEGAHDWAPYYFNLTDTVATVEGSKDVALTSCEYGFKVAYFCADCGKLYTNVPVANDTTNDSQATEEDDKNEAKNNKEGMGFTNEAGFMLDKEEVAKVTDIAQTTFTASDLKTLLTKVDDHKGSHVIYIPMNFASLNNYVASNCISTATIPVVCINCGATLEYSYEALKEGGTIPNFEDTNTPAFKAATQNEMPAGWKDGTNGYLIDTNTFSSKNTVLTKAASVDLTNHAGQTFACGTHCKVTNAQGTAYICGALLKYYDEQNTSVSNPPSVPLTDKCAQDTAHATVTLSFYLSNRLSTSYLNGYTLKIAVVTANSFTDGEVDWSKVTFKTTDSASACAGTTNYKLPTAWNGSNISAGSNYFVLVDAEGNVYPTQDSSTPSAYGLRVFADDSQAWPDGNEGNLMANGASIDVGSDDQFFIDFGYDYDGSKANRPAVPVEATDATSLALAIENAEYDKDKKAYVVEFAAGANIVASYNSDTYGKTFDDVLDAFVELATDKNGTSDAIIFDLNGGTLSITSAKAHFTEDQMTEDSLTALRNFETITVTNGKINYYKGGATAPETKFAITIPETASDVIFDNVDIVSEKGGIYVAPTTTGSVTLKDSSITSYGNYGIFVGDSNEASDQIDKTTRETVVTLENTNITMTRNPVAVTADANAEWALSTALFVGAPVAVEVKGGVFSAAGQAVVVRMGTLSMANTRLVLVEGYEDDDLATAGITADTDLGITSAGYDGSTLGYVASRPLQMYRQYGVWGKLNNVVRAALVIGNSYNCDQSDSDTTKDYYDLPVYVTLNNITFDNSVEDAQNIAIAARYHVDEPEAAETTMVTVKWTGNTQLLKNSVMPNAIASLITINDDNLGA